MNFDSAVEMTGTLKAREPFHCLGAVSDLIKFNRKVPTDFRGALSLAVSQALKSFVAGEIHIQK